ncbi:unnamed protein product, partial [Meganyctiphanes norvegica]
MTALLSTLAGGKVVIALEGQRGGGGRPSAGMKRDFTPVSWRNYWDTCQDVTVECDSFRVYHRGSSGPLLVFLHGGGYSALTWSLVAVSVTEMVECQVMAFDQRGHGDTRTSNDGDLSPETLSRDIANVCAALFGSTQPPTVLVGHSMGGAIAVHASHDDAMCGLAGLVVIDVVEGTAMDALSSMQSFLRSRPSKFNTLQSAIEWSVRSGQTRSMEAAKVSMPGQIKSIETGLCGTNDVDSSANSTTSPSTSSPAVAPRADVIMEEDADNSNTTHSTSESSSPFAAPQPVSVLGSGYTWRIDLGATERYWSGWFKGLSAKFLSAPPGKMLILAGIDRLDTDLTVGQMQGKFQMQVLPQCGHAVQEDTPDRVAQVIAGFLTRYRLAQPRDAFHRIMPAC